MGCLEVLQDSRIAHLCTGEVVPYLSIGGNEIIGNIDFMGLHSTNSPIRYTIRCSGGNTSRLILLSVATAGSNENAVLSVISQMTGSVFVPFAINNKVHSASSFGRLLETNTSGVSIGSTTIEGPSLVGSTTCGFKDRYIIYTVSTGHASGKG